MKNKKIALIYESQSIDYTSLNEKANAVANEIARYNLDVDAAIGLYCSNPICLAIAALGIAKSGHPYTALDCSYPVSRNDYYISESGVQLLVCEKGKEYNCNLKKILIDENISGAESPVNQNFSEVAYYIFTSGSTGKPKMIPTLRKTIQDTLESLKKKMPITSDDVVLSKTSLCYAFSLLDFFYPLMTGCTIVMADPCQNNDSEYISSLIRQNNVSVFTVVPAFLKLLVKEEEFRHAQSLRCVISAAGILTQKTVDEILDYLPELKIYHGYGMSETTSIVCFSLCERSLQNEYVPVTQWIDGVEHYLLDDNNEVSDYGTLYLGGISLNYYEKDVDNLCKRGYIKNPFSKQNELLFHTGDVFKRVDDQLYYVGRNDNMIKINGNRIEIEEIERVLEDNANIKQACVCADKENHYLAAYVSLEKTGLETNDMVKELQGICTLRLPKYMVPSVFRFVDRLPELPNGKLDRKSVGTMDYRVASGNKGLDGSAVQQKLSGIWQSVLGHKEFGQEDEFMLCGGTSIQLMRVKSLICSMFGINLSLTDLLENSTIKAQEKLINGRECNAVPVPDYFKEQDMSGKIPLTDQQRAFFTGMQSEYTTQNGSTYGYAELFCGKYDEKKMEKVLQLIQKVHPMLCAMLSDEEHIIIGRELSVEYMKADNEDDFDKFRLQNRDRLNSYVPDINEPLVKICIISMERKAFLQLYFNTIAMDGMSYTIFCKDISRAYENGVLEDIRYNFKNYIDYNHFRIQTKEYEIAGKFWEDKVAAFSTNPELPFENRLEDISSIKGIYRYVELEESLVCKIKEEAAARKCSFFCCMLTAYAKTVALYNGNPDFIICVPVEHRDTMNQEADRIIGACTSFVYLKIDENIYLPFYEAVEKVQEWLYECRNMSAFSGVELTRKIHKYHPEIQTIPMVIFTSLLENQKKNLVWNCVHAQSHTSQSGLEAVVQLVDNKVRIVFNSFEGLLRDTTIDGMAEVYHNVLKNRLGVPVVPETDKLLMVKMNETNRSIGDETVIQRILYNLEHNGNKTALCTMSSEYSYSWLNNAVRKAAAVLEQQGIRQGERVAVILKKGTGQYIWALAISCYGAVYMPLEHDITKMQAIKIMKHADSRFCILYDENEDNFDDADIAIIYDSAWKSADIITNLPKVEPDQDIIIIHTSGSTGEPKGVLLKERNLRNTLVDTMSLFGVTQADRAIAVTNTAHDLSLFDLFGMIMVGGSAAIPDAENHKNPEHWYALCKATKPTVWNSVPTIMEMFAEYAEFNDCEPLASFRLNIHGGEFVPLTLPGRIHAIEPNAGIISIGGPTETTIWNICHSVTDQDVQNGVIPYGRPMANTRYYILDENLNQVPAYVHGVMYVAGYSVAAGYVNRPEETKEKFIIHPVTKEFLYCTGDVGYFNEEGEICIIGRKDNQVKLFGKRIELEGIEFAIGQQEYIENVKVCVDKEEGYIAAFFKASEQIHIPSLIAGLSEVLPAYMIPRYFMQTDSFPVLPNGKTDYKALMESLVRSDEEETDFSLLGRIRRIFLDVLGVSQIENDSNFFYAGGNSIKAIHIMQQILVELNCKIELSDFLLDPTIWNMYELIIHCKTKQPLTGITFKPEPDKMYEPFPLQDLQASYLIGRQNDLRLGNITTHGYVEITCDDYDDLRFRKALRKLGERHPIFSLAIYDEYQQFLPQLHIPEIETEYVGDMTEQEFLEYLEGVRKDMTATSMDPAQPPLVRIKIIYREAKKVLIAMYLDSLIIDGWSYEILYSELEELYANPDTELEPVAITFRDYVNYRTAFRQSEIYKRDKEYWLQRIETLSEPIDIPLLKRPEEITEVTGNLKYCYLSFEQWRKLEKTARINGVSPFSVLFTSFALVLARWNQKQNFLLSIPEYDRPEFDPDIKRMVGVCTSFLIFDMDNRPHETFLEVVKRVQKQIWELNEHHSFTGIEVMREICRRKNVFDQAQVPIVFSSFLDVPQTDKKYLLTHYSETHTSQIYIDIDTMVCGDRIEFNWNAIKGLMSDDMLTDMTHLQMEILNNAADDKEFWNRECVLKLPLRDRNIINACNDTEHPFEYISMAKLIEKSFRENADRICMVDEEHRYTYSDMYRMVMEKCAVLSANGLKAEERAAILCKKSVDMYAFILACVFRGITYVPLEYDYPAVVIQQCCRNANCRAIITDRGDELEDTDMIVISPLEKGHDCYDEELYESIEEHVFVIIHTSGSTGVPKAVKVGEKGLENSLLFTNRTFKADCDDSILAVTNIAHDMSMYDLFGLLLAGGKICIVPHKYRRNAEYWLSVMDTEKVTLWNSVPAMIQMLLMVMKPEQSEVIRNLKFVISGGDYLTMNTVTNIRSISPDTVIYNVGGPTETTLWNIWHEVTNEDIDKGILPYGKPIDNTRYYLLNEKMEEVPVGVVGMMYCAGVGITYGYENNTDETLARYVIYEKTGERIYCTGDLGCYDNQGRILFKGREDNQVKINGKRIEIDGIVSVIESFEKTIKAYVLVKEDNQIIAFYSSESMIATEALQHFVGNKLPIYMIPQRFIQVSTIPLNAVGKPDKQAMLAIAEQSNDEVVAGKEMYFDCLEETLCQMCRELLNDNLYQIDSNFFLAGGNSISAIQLLAMIRQEYQVEISLTEILQEPVIAAWHDIILRRLMEKEIRQEQIAFY